MRFIHIADIHLGAKPDKGKKWGRFRQQEIENSFGEIMNICNAQKIDLLFIAGDLFHYSPTIEMLKNANYYFSKLETTRVILIAGNHDYLCPQEEFINFKFEDNVYFIKSKDIEEIYFKDINTSVKGFSYYSREIVEPLYDAIRGDRIGSINILLGHGGDDKHIPIDFSKVKWSGFDYVALGHIHKPALIEDGLIGYAGSLEPLDSTEKGERGFIYGEIRDNERFVEFHPLSKRNYINIVIELNENMVLLEIKDLIIKNVLQYGIDNIFTVILTGVKGIDTDINLDDLIFQYNINEVKEEYVENIDYSILLEANPNNLLGAIISELGQREDELSQKALRYGVKAILKTQKK